MKLDSRLPAHKDKIVAPRRGAWIETPSRSHSRLMPKSRTPQGCVD